MSDYTISFKISLDNSSLREKFFDFFVKCGGIYLRDPIEEEIKPAVYFEKNNETKNQTPENLTEAKRLFTDCWDINLYLHTNNMENIFEKEPILFSLPFSISIDNENLIFIMFPASYDFVSLDGVKFADYINQYWINPIKREFTIHDLEIN
jgi:hypothetical protein